MKQVAPAAPVAPWLGGKKQLHRTIIDRIDRIQHDTYVEPFVGMGGVFLRRGWQPKCEVANDLNGEIHNLFRILQQHYAYLIDEMRFRISSLREFDRLRSVDPSTLTDIQRAALFLYLQRQAFGGQVGGVFGVAPGTASRFSLSRLEPILDAAHGRLEGVVLECLRWQEVVSRWDSASTLFYLDPPYYNCEKDYGKDLFDRSQFEEMASALASIAGAFIMSINDTPEIRALFADFHIEPVSLKYSVSKDAQTDAAELIISNREVNTGLL